MKLFINKLFRIILLATLTIELANCISMLYEQPIGYDLGSSADIGPPLARSSSKIWYEGYKAGCTQFLQNYIPDHRDGKSLVIGIAGGSGSGKTTIKDVIVEQLCPVISLKRTGSDLNTLRETKCPHIPVKPTFLPLD
jgi:hypothetical protein